MKKLFEWENIVKIILTLLGSVISVFLIFPLVLELNFIKNFFKSNSIRLMIGVGAIILFLLFFTWKRMTRFWVRYRETKKTGNFPLINVNLIVIYFYLTKGLSILSDYVDALKIKLPFISREFNWFVVIIAIPFLVWLISSFLINNNSSEETDTANKESNNVNKVSNLDDPIKSHKEDLLRRDKFVEDLYRHILNLLVKLTGSFTIGLNGSWGEGKTSVINLLIEKMRRSPDFSRDFLIIQFDPWHFEDEKAILNAFYDHLEKTFSRKFILPDIKRSISKFQKLISTGLSLPGFSFNINIADNSIEEIKKRIEHNIEQVGRKVLIIIDDIDRLQPDEIMLVFKLIRKNSDFKNTIFLLSFDQSVLIESLKNQKELDEDFLEKIINITLPLPAVEKETIERLLFDQINQLLKEKSIPDNDRSVLFKEFSDIYEYNDIYKLFKTLRLVKRYIYSLSFTLPSIIAEVNPNDFLILEMIRIFEYDLYIWIHKHKRFLAPSMYEENYGDINQILRNKNAEKSKLLKAEIDSLFIDNDRKEIFEKLLMILFPLSFKNILTGKPLDYSGIYENRNKKRISHPECFEKYFAFLVPDQDISDAKIETIIKTWKSKPSKKQKTLRKNYLIELNKKGKIHILIQKLADFIEKIDPQLAPSLIEVIYENTTIFPKGINVRTSDLSKAGELMLRLINDKSEKDSIPGLIENAVMKTPDLFFSVLIVFHLNEEKQERFLNIYNSGVIDHLKLGISQRLKEYFVDEENDIFEIYNGPSEWSFILNNWGDDWESRDGQINKIVQDYVLSLVKNDVKKFSNFFRETAFNNPHGIIGNFNVAFNKFQKRYNLEVFKEVAQKFKGNESLSEEERDIINKFLEWTPPNKVE